MEIYQKYFRVYWKLRSLKKKLNEKYSKDTETRLRKIRPVISAMRKARLKIERDIYLFPQEFRIIPE